MSAAFTAEDRAVIEDCIDGACPCEHCTVRRATIAKLLAAYDAERLANTEAQLQQRVARAMETPLTVEALRASVFAALTPPSERTIVRSYASEDPETP